MFEQKLYELRVEGRGTCEFRATRPYGVGDSKSAIAASYKDLAEDGYIFVFQDIRGR